MFKNLHTLYYNYRDRWTLVVMFWLFQVMDIFTTQTFVEMHGVSLEGNPIMRWVIIQGWGWVWAIKILVCGLAPRLAIKHRTTFLVLLYMYALIIVNNILCIKHMIPHG